MGPYENRLRRASATTPSDPQHAASNCGVTPSPVRRDLVTQDVVAKGTVLEIRATERRRSTRKSSATRYAVEAARSAYEEGARTPESRGPETSASGAAGDLKKPPTPSSNAFRKSASLSMLQPEPLTASAPSTATAALSPSKGNIPVRLPKAKQLEVDRILGSDVRAPLFRRLFGCLFAGGAQGAGRLRRRSAKVHPSMRAGLSM